MAKKEFHTVGESVVFVIEKMIGDKSSLRTLIKTVWSVMSLGCRSHYNYNVNHPSLYNSVAQYRSAWRRDNNSPSDCRTYQSQPRRDQLHDKKLKVETYNSTLKFLANVDIDEFITLLGGFHSIDQLKITCQHISDNVDLVNV